MVELDFVINKQRSFLALFFNKQDFSRCNFACLSNLCLIGLCICNKFLKKTSNPLLLILQTVVK